MLNGWDDGGNIGALVDPYSIGGGGEGWAFVAERIHLDASFGSPCTSYVVIKFPMIDDDGSPRVDLRRVQRLRAEYDRRQWLGDVPHLGHVPSLRFLPRALLENPQGPPSCIRFEIGEATTIPVLVTPLQGTRTGGMVPADLASLIPKTGCWSSRDVLNWTVVARGLARALWSMHGRGWAHCDIKPQNVVLYESRGTWHEVNLIDFGLVTPDMPGTINGNESGSPRYWRVERLQDHSNPNDLAHLRPSTEDIDRGYIFEENQPVTSSQYPSQLRGKPGPEFEDVMEYQKALAWSDDDALTESMLEGVEVEDEDAILTRAEDYQQNGKSTQEAVHAALQIVRWKLTRLENDPSKLLLEMMRTWTHAVGWALVADLHHEYASAMLLVAHQAKKVFGVEAHLESSTEARIDAPVGHHAIHGGTVRREGASWAVVEKLLRTTYNIDGEAVLSTGAECALAAASTYTDIDAPLLAWRALQLAAGCLSACEAPEQRVDAVRWLQFAKNDCLLHEPADPTSAVDTAKLTDELKNQVIGRSDLAIASAIARWATCAERVYKKTAGTDPAAFLSKAMFGRYGAGIARLTAGSLGVELVGKLGEPCAGETVKRLLASTNYSTSRSPQNMLEIECGLGHDCKVVGDPPGESVFARMQEVWGIESMPWYERKARVNCKGAERVQIRGMDIYAPDDDWKAQHMEQLGGRQFNVVWMHDVLVRVSDRKRLLERAHSLLVPGGTLMMTDWVQTKQMSQEGWRDLCELAWLTGPETQLGYEHLLRAAQFEAVKTELHSDEMIRAFKWAKNGPQSLPGDAEREAETDFSAILRAKQSFARLLALAEAKKSGWVWVTARRGQLSSIAHSDPRDRSGQVSAPGKIEDVRSNTGSVTFRDSIRDLTNGR